MASTTSPIAFGNSTPLRVRSALCSSRSRTAESRRAIRLCCKALAQKYETTGKYDTKVPPRHIRKAPRSLSCHSDSQAFFRVDEVVVVVVSHIELHPLNLPGE